MTPSEIVRSVGFWCAIALVCSLPVQAASNDIYLLGLLDESGNPDNESFRALTTELGLVMTPLPMKGAETTGQAGFDFGADFGVHVISFWEDYWKNGRVGTGLERRDPIVPAMNTIGLRGRKSFIFPVPLQSELEFGAQWLIGSRMASVGAKFHLALNEGFRWIPDVGVSAGINRLIGSDDLYVTTATLGGQVSKGFGLFGDVNIMPYLSYESIFIDAQSRSIDTDARSSSDIGSLVSFDRIPMVAATTNDTNACLGNLATCLVMNRIDRGSIGFRFNVAVVQIALGVDVNYIPGRQIPVMVQGGMRFGLLF